MPAPPPKQAKSADIIRNRSGFSRNTVTPSEPNACRTPLSPLPPRSRKNLTADIRFSAFCMIA